MAVPASAMPNMPHLFAKHEVATYGGDVAHVSHPYRNSSRGYSGDAAACYGASTLSLFVGHLALLLSLFTGLLGLDYVDTHPTEHGEETR
jgi:hypothetical protein